MKERVAQAIRGATRLLCTCHRGPDGDAVGSLLATGLLLGRLDKAFLLYCPDPIPNEYRFLPLAGEVVTHLSTAERFDVSIALDAGDASLLGPDFPPEDRAGTVIVMDHHASGRRFGDLYWHEPDASAAGVLVADLARALDIPLDTELAAPLWCALYTDTGGFRYSSTNAATLRLAAELTDTGLNPWDVTSRVYEQNPAARVHLLARVLGTLTLSDSGRIASLIVTEQMLDETGADKSMLDGFINYGRGIAGVEVALQVRQQGESCRISFRSKGKVDVGSLAQRLGGGGHHNAAGCELRGTPEAVRKKALGLLEEELARVLTQEPE
jgi:phosphoesterase RecJ-like protein